MAVATQYKFQTQSGADLLTRYLDEVILFDDLPGAKMLVDHLGKLLEENRDLEKDNPALYESYEQILIKARFIALPLLTEPIVLSLIEENLPVALELPDYNLGEKLKAFLLKYPVLDDRDAVKNKLKQALINSDLIITPESVIRYGQKVEGSIKNWLTDYVINLGTDPVESVKLSQYLINSPSVKELGPESRAKLEKLFKFFEGLKLTSLSPLGAEEKSLLFFDNEWHVLDEGRFVKTRDTKTDRIVEQAIKLFETKTEKGEAEQKIKGKKERVERMRRLYEGDPKEQAEIAKDEKLIQAQIAKRKASEQAGVLAEILEKGLDQRDRIKVIATLRILAAKNGLSKILVENKRLIDPFLVYLKAQPRPGLLEGFKLEPTAPIYLSLFLQYLLRSRLGLNENDSGRVGMQIVNLLRKAGVEKYNQIAYFDLESESFKWRA